MSFYCLKPNLKSENAFVAGLANTIIQLVYLTQPAVAESGGPRNFFQGM